MNIHVPTILNVSVLIDVVVDTYWVERGLAEG